MASRTLGKGSRTRTLGLFTAETDNEHDHNIVEESVCSNRGVLVFAMHPLRMGQAVVVCGVNARFSTFWVCLCVFVGRTTLFPCDASQCNVTWCVCSVFAQRFRSCCSSFSAWLSVCVHCVHGLVVSLFVFRVVRQALHHKSMPRCGMDGPLAINTRGIQATKQLKTENWRPSNSEQGCCSCKQGEQTALCPNANAFQTRRSAPCSKKPHLLVRCADPWSPPSPAGATGPETSPPAGARRAWEAKLTGQGTRP